MGQHEHSGDGVNNDAQGRTTWPLAAGLVVAIGFVGLLLLTQGTVGRVQTIGQAMLTAALVAGPFLWAEWLVNRNYTQNSVSEVNQLALVGRDLRNQELDGRDLHGQVFVGCNLAHSRFSESGLVESVFDKADMRHVVARGADMTRASLRLTNCAFIDLRSAQLVAADLNQADLRNSDLRFALLCDADLRGADLRGADLRGADLDGAQLKNALYSDTTLWQGNMNLEYVREELGMVEVANDSLPLDEDIDLRPNPKTIDVRRGPRAAVGTAVLLAAAAAIMVPRIAGPEVIDARVSGVSLEKPFVELTGTSDQVRVEISVDGEVIQQFKARELPVTVALADLQRDDEVVVRVENLDPDSGDATCRLGLGDETWTTETSTSEESTISCGAVVR